VERPLVIPSGQVLFGAPLCNWEKGIAGDGQIKGPPSVWVRAVVVVGFAAPSPVGRRRRIFSKGNLFKGAEAIGSDLALNSEE